MTEKITKNEQKYKQLQSMMNMHLSYLDLFKNDDYHYEIMIDYRDSKIPDEAGTLEYRIKRLQDDNGNIDKFKCIQIMKCEHLIAVELIDEIRNNFILNHHISLPSIGPRQIRIPDTFFYSTVICQNLKNTKFLLIVSLRTEIGKEKADVAHQKAKQKMMNSGYQKVIEKKD